MNKKRLLIQICCWVAAILVLFLWFRSRNNEEFVVPDHIVIWLDAGHGGDDPGAVNGERQEKDDNLAVMGLVAHMLTSAGYDNLEVHTSGGYDTFTLEDRVTLANEKHATLFVSLHRNSGGGQGVETWVSAEGHPHELQLANYIHKQLLSVGVSKDRGVKKGTASNPSASYYVVGNTNMPACLVELGFIDSETDNALLDEHLDAYAQAIADGILQMVRLK